MEVLNNAVIEQLGLTLLHFLWQGALIGLLFCLCLIIGRPSSAQTRYSLAVATLLALAITPVLTFIYLGSSGAGAAALAGTDHAPLMQIVVTFSSGQQASTLLAWTVAGWLSGVLVLSARLILGWRYIAQLRRSAQHEVVTHFKPLLDRLRATMAIRKSVALAVSERINSPVVVGWLKPLILFPPALIARLGTAQIEMILAHELAHIRRHDHLVNLFQISVETLLFYHPVVALVSRRIRIERENACDDLAVRATKNRLAYVEMLAALEHLRQPGPRLALSVRDGQILGRIRRLVERSRPRRQLGITLPALLGLTLAAGSTGLWLMPEPETAPAAAVLTQAPPLNQSLRFDATQALPLAANRSASIEGPQTAAILPGSAAPGAAANNLAGPASDPDARASVVESDLSDALVPTDLGVNDDVPPAAGASLSRIEESIEQAADEPSVVERPSTEALEQRATELTRPEQLPAPDPATLVSIDPPELELAMRPTPTRITQASPSSNSVAIEPPELRGGALLRQIEPEFPRKARRRGVNGMVELEFTIDRRGQVQSVGVVQERPIGWSFGEAAAAAIEQWRFEPFRRGDEAIDRQVRVEVEFDLAEVCEISTGSRLPRC